MADRRSKNVHVFSCRRRHRRSLVGVVGEAEADAKFSATATRLLAMTYAVEGIERSPSSGWSCVTVRRHCRRLKRVTRGRSICDLRCLEMLLLLFRCRCTWSRRCCLDWMRPGMRREPAVGDEGHQSVVICVVEFE